MPVSPSRVLMEGVEIDLAGGDMVEVGLAWDAVRGAGKIDLDVTAVLFDSKGAFEESIYFANTASVSGAVRHLGDNRDGAGDGDDETLLISLRSMPQNIHTVVLVVTSYSGTPLRAVESAEARLRSDVSGTMKEEGVYYLGAGGTSTAMLLGALHRADSKAWRFASMAEFRTARHFGELIPAMQMALEAAGICANVRLTKPSDVVVLTKGESVRLEDRSGLPLKNVMLGLGWDTLGSAPVDLDASVLTFDINGKMLEAIYFGNLQSKDASIRHSGDNLTGAGDGDDEQIVIDLLKLPARVESCYLIVNSYSGHKLSIVRNAYCRLADPSGAREFIRFQLSEGAPQGSAQTAMIMSKLTRDTTSDGTPGWRMTALGYATSGRTYKDNVAEMQTDIQTGLPLGNSPYNFSAGGVSTQGRGVGGSNRAGSSGAGGGGGGGGGGVSGMGFLIICVVACYILYKMGIL